MAEPPRTTLSELGGLFFRLGVTAFGGPAAHIAMMRDEVVTRRAWLTQERFLDLVGATQLIPGPNSTEMAMHVGWERRRWSGLLVAGLAFIVPAALITAAFAVAYVRFGRVPAVAGLLYGIKPVILGVVVQAIVALAQTAARTTPLRVLAVLCVTAAALRVHELEVLFGAGLASMAFAWRRPDATTTHDAHQLAPHVPQAPHLPLAQPSAPSPALATGTLGASAAAGGIAAATLPSVFWVFLKTGSVLFGSGYVLLAFLRADLVQRLHWLTEPQLIDAIAVGQVTPGPVFTTATFIGYVLAGPGGAIVATVGIFLPAFVLVALSGPLIPRLRASPRAGRFLDGVNVASLALMAVVTVELGRAAIVDGPTVVLALVSAGVLIRYKPNATWLVVAGGAAGLLVDIWVRR